MIGALFFEVEGVIASTSALRRAALLRALADEGLAGAESPADGAAIADCAERDTRDAVRHALRGHAIASDETTLTLIALRADRHFASLVQAGVSLAPGARELLALAASRCRLAIVTGLTRASVDSVLSLAELDGAIEVIVAAEDVTAPKPASDGYRKALERASRKRPLDITTAIALESSAAGVRAAHGAGLRCAVIVPSHETSIAGADATLVSLVGETPATLGAMLSIRAVG